VLGSVFCFPCKIGITIEVLLLLSILCKNGGFCLDAVSLILSIFNLVPSCPEVTFSLNMFPVVL